MKIIKVKSLKDAEKLMAKYKKEKPKKLVVKYYMDGCGACQNFEPTWQNVIEKLDIPSTIMIADVESNAQQHLPIPNKMGFPTLSILSDDGEGSFREQDERIGSIPQDELMSMLTKAISSQAGGKKKHRTRTKKRRVNKIKRKSRTQKHKRKRIRDKKRKSNRRTRR